MTEINWLDLYMPSHKCTVCGAMWRFFRWEDFPKSGINYDSWTLCSNTCGKCCDNVAMGEQIAPIKRKDALEWLQAWAAVEKMKEHVSAECGACDKPGEHCHRPFGICIRYERAVSAQGKGAGD